MKKCLFFFTYLFFQITYLKAQTTPAWDWGKDFTGDVVATQYHNNFVYAVGEYESPTINIDGTILPNLGGKDIFITKWDTSGNLIWAFNISDTGNQHVFTFEVDGNNDIVISGYFSPSTLVLSGNTYSSGAANHGFICKMNQSGNFIWANTFNSSYLTPFILSNLKLYKNFFKTCLDNANNIYLHIPSLSLLNKYNSNGVPIWSKSFTSSNDLRYSSFDNKLVICKTFTGTLTINGITVTSINGAGYSSGLIGKSDTSGIMQWLTPFDGGNYEEDNLLSINQLNGKIYCAEKSGYNLSADKTFSMKEILPNGALVNSVFTFEGDPFPPIYVYPYSSAAEVYAISGTDSFICLSLVYEYFKAITIYNTNSHKVERVYYHNNGTSKYSQAIAMKSLNAIFTEGATYTNSTPSSSIAHSFGRLNGSILFSQPSSQVMHTCGGVVNLTGNVYGGYPPYTYSWSPSAGLSSINSISTNLTVTSSNTYILTITDSIGQIIQDTFHVVLDTPLTGLTITPEFSSFCKDSMHLYSNLGVAGNWYKFGSTWTLNTPNSFGVNTTIYSFGLFRFEVSNACNTIADTIQIEPTLTTLQAIASDTSLCLGDSLILNGSGADTYSWSGGVLNNIAFVPSATQTYSVTGTDINGCINNSYVHIEVKSTPIISGISATPSTLCAGGNTTLLVTQSATYCTPQVYFNGASGHYISNITFAGGAINNTSGDGPGDYNYYSSSNANVMAGGLYSFGITANAQYRKVWIDFNQDGDFEEASELVFQTTSGMSSGNILVPITAINGKTRMRVAVQVFSMPSYCSNSDFGEYEDYNISISGGVNNITWTPSIYLNSNDSAQVHAINILTSTVYTATVTSTLGCTKSANITINVIPISNSTTNASTCYSALPYVWNSQSLTSAGTYTSTFINAAGCDSIATLNLTVNSTSASTTNTTICSSSLPYVWNSQSLTSAGTYTSTFTNAVGCDSIATLNLTVKSTSSSTTNTTICSSSLPFVWNSQSLTSTGIYTSNFTNAVGCDSVATLNLTVKSTSASTTNTTICSSSLPYVWNSQSLTSTGTYTSTFTNAVGCDSVATLNLTVKSTSASTTNTTICSSSLPYVWNSQSLTSTGTYTSTFINSVGCDSIATLNLTVNPTSASTTNTTICSSSFPYVWNSQSLTSAGTYTSTFTNAVGCDFIATLNLTVNPTSASTTNTTICSSSLPYVWNSQSLTSAGTYTSTFTNAVGCDSVAALNLVVNSSPIVSINPFTDSSICIGSNYVLHVDSLYSSYTWTWNGNIVSSNDSILIDSSGTYIVSCTDSNGCIGLDTVSITILPSPQPSIIQNNYTLTCTNTSNVSYQWYLNGNAIGTNDSVLTITQDGQYIVKITDSAGCIGFDTLTVVGLGIQGITFDHSISIYPNPTSGVLTVGFNLNEPSVSSLYLLDATGKVVTEFMSNRKLDRGEYKQTFNLNEIQLAKGVYLLRGTINGIQWVKQIHFEK